MPLTDPLSHVASTCPARASHARTAAPSPPLAAPGGDMSRTCRGRVPDTRRLDPAGGRAGYRVGDDSLLRRSVEHLCRQLREPLLHPLHPLQGAAARVSGTAARTSPSQRRRRKQEGAHSYHSDVLATPGPARALLGPLHALQQRLAAERPLWRGACSQLEV